MDKSFLGRLKRMFSQQTIVTHINNNQIKVLDLNKYQQTGGLQTNYFTDRFTRLYQGNNNIVGAFGSSVVGFQQGILRSQLYAEYEMMNQDAIISSALDILASKVTTRNLEGDILKIKTSDEEIKQILTNLFYDVLSVDENLYGWVRTMLMYGDSFLYIKLMEDYGVVGTFPMSTYLTSRIEDPKTGETNFIYDETGYTSSNAIKYQNFEIAHFRLNSDTSYYPYGKSYIENARKTWKMLTLMEDASLLHRLMRSADKRIYSIDIGGLPANEVDAYMEKIINSSKKTPFMDYNTGDYNLKYNMMNLLEDYYLPKRGDRDATKIENINGLTFAGMEDVNYHKDKLFMALKIPKSEYTEIGDLNGTSTLANQTINFVPIVERIQNSVISELYKIALVHLYSRGFRSNNLMNFELELTSPSIIYEQEKIALLKEKVELMTTMMDNNIASSDWLYKNILYLSEDEYDNMRDEVLEDKKRLFRISQIENEGNDPLESGESYGTPHDLANLYNDKTDVVKPDPMDGANNFDKQVLGRPIARASNLNTDDNVLGRDRLGVNRGTNVKSQTNPNPNTVTNLYEQVNPKQKKKVNVYLGKTVEDTFKLHKLHF